MKSYGWRIFLLLVCSMFVALPLASAESAGSASGSKLIQQENWFNSYWGLHLGMTSTDERSEFYATGPNGEAWMVSIAGDRFRLRDWHHQKPTVYTKELHYETSHMGGTQISKAIIDADGRLYDVSKNCYGISTVRFSGNLVINTDVFVVK
ncbi:MULTISPECIES: hypothetical protein [unclassified Paenibacillus]|uniref:hypothetical protein n=1 Tax=unclassified Paenibacillus TaxID=185978 RepID=UPI0009302FA0|nr:MULTISPECIES: hypothetical protein [unclassified Paenibacillus]